MAWTARYKYLVLKIGIKTMENFIKQSFRMQFNVWYLDQFEGMLYQSWIDVLYV